MERSNSELAISALVADDDPVFRSLVEARLVHLGCRFLHAAEGGEAWQLTRSNKLDIALVDFEMPGLDGIALTRCLRSHPQTRHIPIIMCTSRTDATAMKAALEAGVSSFLTKPINWSLFESHIRHLLHASQAVAQCIAVTERLEAINAQKDAHVARLLAALQSLTKSSAAALAPELKAALGACITPFAAAYGHEVAAVSQFAPHAGAETSKRQA